MKKLLSWILLVCMIATMLPLSLSAEGSAAPSEPAIHEAPADATPITDLASLLLPNTAGGSFKLTQDLHITKAMIAAYLESLDGAPSIVSPEKDENGDPIYFTADGKIAYDKVNGETKADTAEGATGNVKDVNGEDVYYQKGDALSAPKIAYDTVNGTLNYEFTAALITTNKGTDAGDEAVWEANKAGRAIYGGGHSITFEKGITFAGCAVLVNKIYGSFAIYDLDLGSPEYGVEMVIASMANVGMVSGGTVDVTKGEETLEASLYAENVNIYGSIDETGRNADNNVGGFCAKPDDFTEVTIKNCDSYIDVFRTKDKTNLAKTANYSGFIGTWQGSTLLIEDSNYYGTITQGMNGSKDDRGGSAGFVATTMHNTTEGSTVTLKNCTNYGTIIAPRLGAGMIAITGLDVTLENCVNRGTIIQCDDGESNIGTCAAGLIASVSGGSVTATGCANESSNISTVSPSTEAVASGLIGLMYDREKVTLTDCFSFTSADISMVNGAAIRFDAPTKLRFRATLSASLVKMIEERYGAEKVKVGMKIAKLSDYEAAGSFDALTDAQLLTVDGTWFDEENTTFVATTNEIAQADYGTKYIATAYVTLIDAQGGESTVYAAVNTEAARSVSDVAKAALADRVPVAIAIKGYVYEISSGSFSMYTPAGNEKLQAYVVEATPAS